MQANIAKQRLREGKSILGVHIPFAAPAVVELAAAAGFHWVLIDCEHGPMNEETVETMIRAAEWAGITPVVRPPRNEGPTILRYLDMGAQGIFVPNVQSKTDAEAAVRYAKFHPYGQRGLGPYARWARGTGSQPLPDMIGRANENVMVTLLVESVEGAEKLDEILNVAGVDVIDIGMADLSQSLGLPGRVSDAKVQACANQAFDRIVKAGRAAGCGATTPDQAKRLLDRGLRSILVGADALLLEAGRAFVRGTGVD